jgi:hypothetical protein
MRPGAPIATRSRFGEVGDVHALGAARIAFGFLLLLQAWAMASEQLHEGYFGDHFHYPYLPESLVPSERVYVLILCAQAVAGVLVVLGHFARPAMFFSALAITYAMLSDRLHYHHNRWALACYVFILSFSPCDRARALGVQKGADTTGLLWAQRLAQLQVSIIYLASGSAKLLDPDWRSGVVLLDRMMRYGHYAVERGVPERVVTFFQQDTVASLVSKGAITTELFLAFALQSRRLRLVALFVGFWFHVTIELTAKVELFGATTLAAYLLFATPDARARSLRFDPTRPKAVVLARVVRALDWLARFDVAPWEPDAVKRSRSLVVTDREGVRHTGFRGIMALMRALPVTFPLWAIVAPFVRQRAVVGSLAALVAFGMGISSARADDVPISKVFGYSAYERETLAMVQKRLGGEIDPAPEGKTIESITTERLEVFEKRDFLPSIFLFVNVLHATSRDHVIRREVLQHEGDRYSALLMDETARNLRNYAELSLVLVVALRGSTPNSVRVVVVTKDVWSLRLQWDVQLTNGGLQELVLQPAETNLGGIDHTIGANFLYQPLSTALGGYYYVPRLDGTHIALSASANAILSNVNGAPEGSFGGVSAGQPLWSTQTKWAWAATAAWREEITRVYSNAALATYASNNVPERNAIGYAPQPSLGCSRTPPSPSCGQGAVWPPTANIPWEYRTTIAQSSVAVARSFGWAFKNDFTLSLNASHSVFRTDNLSLYDPAAVNDFVTNNVPVSDDRAYPALEWRSYTTNFLRVTDMETFSLQEDVRLGHFLDVQVYPVSTAFGSSKSFLGIYAEAGYTFPIRDGVLRLDVQTTTETTSNSGGLNVIQGVVDATSYFASPRTPIGRLVFSARILDRYADYLNTISYLGADTRLRGYPSSYFAGKDLVAANLEYRSRPFEIWKVQLGGVAFYDAGEAFTSFSPAASPTSFRPVQDVGFGLRALFPTFDRIVFRADVGFPVSGSPLPPGVGPVTFFVTFSQAFPFPALGLQSTSVGSLTTNVTR